MNKKEMNKIESIQRVNPVHRHTAVGFCLGVANQLLTNIVLHVDGSSLKERAGTILMVDKQSIKLPGICSN